MTRDDQLNRKGRRDRTHSDLMSLLAEDDLLLAASTTDCAESSIPPSDSNRAASTVFPQSVASGSPTSTGVLLWTRIDPAAYTAEHSLFVEVATDDDFSDSVHHGVVNHVDRLPAHDYCVKVDLDGLLDAGQHYYYRFTYDGVVSQTGHCRTLPAPDSSPERVRFAVVCCQYYQNGYYGAYHHIAEEDADYLLHLGDVIYDSAGDDFKGPGSPDCPDRTLSLPSGHDRPRTVEDYRKLYATYRADRFHQEALEQHTLIATHDDHEIADGIYWNDETNSIGAEHPQGDDPAFMTDLVAQALRAWWEYMPVRIGYSPTADEFHESFQLWRQFQFGDLVDLILTEERLFRDAPLSNGLISALGTSSERNDPDRTMLGANQRSWFSEQLQDSTATWTVWADEVLTVPLKLGVSTASIYPVQSAWDGYVQERQQIMNDIDTADVSNFIALSGDMHCYLAGYQQTEYDESVVDFFTSDNSDSDNRVGIEFMTPALTSKNIAESVGVNHQFIAEPTQTLLSSAVRAQNPHIELFDSHHWGYSVVEFTPNECTYTAYSVDKTVDSVDTKKEVVAMLRTPEGRVEINELSGGSVN